MCLLFYKLWVQYGNVSLWVQYVIVSSLLFLNLGHSVEVKNHNKMYLVERKKIFYLKLNVLMCI